MFILLSFLFAFKDKGKFFLQSCSRIYRSKFINLKVTYLAKTTYSGSFNHLLKYEVCHSFYLEHDKT
jgi:hypothetical protein